MRKDRKTPQRVKPTVPTQNTTSVTSSLFSGLFQGFSFGAGSSMAHNLFRLPYTGATVDTSTVTPVNPCESITKEYLKACIENLSTDPKKCNTIWNHLEAMCNQNPQNE